MEKPIQIEIRFTRVAATALLGLPLLLIALVLLLQASPAIAGSGTSAPQSQTVTGISTAVGNRIHYQGRLAGAGGPVEVTFRLWVSARGRDLSEPRFTQKS